MMLFVLFPGKVGKIVAFSKRATLRILLASLELRSFSQISFKNGVAAWIFQFSMPNETNRSTGWRSVHHNVSTNTFGCVHRSMLTILGFEPVEVM
jgi:hypothetical protein